MKKYFCFYCQKEIKPERWRFRFVCPHCGCYVTDDGSGFHKICDKCEAELPTDSAVCMKCGYHFSGENARKVHNFEFSDWHKISASKGIIFKPLLRFWNKYLIYLLPIFTFLLFYVLGTVLSFYHLREIVGDYRYIPSENRFVIHYTNNGNNEIMQLNPYQTDSDFETIFTELYGESEIMIPKIQINLYGNGQKYQEKEMKAALNRCADVLKAHFINRIQKLCHKFDKPCSKEEISRNIHKKICIYNSLTNCRNKYDRTYKYNDGGLYIKTKSAYDFAQKPKEKRVDSVKECVATVGLYNRH
ncbi:MAG: zinc ribbon domain-containing protein [Alphaproteobacteria bacterium]|nr:zinc ribbon domain-containing protein [Alphaproteobacteria bacterium]